MGATEGKVTMFGYAISWKLIGTYVYINRTKRAEVVKAAYRVSMRVRGFVHKCAGFCPCATAGARTTSGSA